MNDPLYNLLQKYDVPAPRYTSYPTVLAWTSDVQENDYLQNLSFLKAGECLSLYFHLPFCESLCHFCGCMQVITKDHSRSKSYVETLITEIDLIASKIPEDARLVNQIHFGGGTPNFIQPAELKSIMQRVQKHFKLTDDAEVAIEMHPRTSTKEFCEMLKKLKFNRISLGVQDFDERVQKLINRHQTYEMTKFMIDTLRDLGFDSFNIDLVYGLPGQTQQTWADTLKKVSDLKPNRLAVYSYAHVPWVRPVQRTFKDSDLPSPETKLKLFEQAYACFTQGGYNHIGIDHFARSDDELAVAYKNHTMHRNFMGYSTRADSHQIGMGVSAISFVGGNYFQNQKDLKKYCETIESGHLATLRGFILKRDDTMRRDLITQIMCNGFVDTKEFGKRWGIDFWHHFAVEKMKLFSFCDDDLLEIYEGHFQVKGAGALFLRNMAMIFDAHHEGIKQKSTTPAFSKAI